MADMTPIQQQPQIVQEQQKLAQIQQQYQPLPSLPPNIVYQKAFQEQQARVEQLQQQAPAPSTFNPSQPFTVVQSISSGGWRGGQYHSSGEFSRTQEPTWDTTGSKPDRTEDVIRDIVSRPNVIIPESVYRQYQKEIDAYKSTQLTVVPDAKIGEITSRGASMVEQIEAEKAAIQAQRKAEFGGVITPSARAILEAPIGTPIAGLQAEAQKELRQLEAKQRYLQSSTAQWGSQEDFGKALADVTRFGTEVRAPTGAILLSTPEQRALERGLVERTGLALVPESFASPAFQAELQRLPPKEKDILGLRVEEPPRFDLEAMKTAAWRKDVGDPFAIPSPFEKSLEKLAPKKEPMFVSEPEGGFFTGMTRAVGTAMRGIEERLTLPKTGTPIDIPIGSAEMGIKGVASLPLTPFVVAAVEKKGVEEPGKVPEFIKGGAELAAAGIAEKPIETGLLLGLGLYGARARIPKLRFEEASRSKMVSQLFEPTTRSESLTATKELFGDVKTSISREIARPTIREEALISTERLFGGYGRTLEREIAKPTIREESIVSVGKLAKEELARPTIREKAVSGLKEAVAEEVKVPTERQIALAETRRLFGDVGKTFGREILESRPTTRAESLRAIKEVAKEEISRPTVRRESLEAVRGEIKGVERKAKYILERPSGGYPKMEYFKKPTKEYIEAKYKEFSPLETGRKIPEEPRPPIITERPPIIARRVVPESKPLREIFRDVAGGTYEQTKIIGRKYGEKMIPRELYAPGFKFEELGARIPIKEKPKLPRQITPTTELKVTEIPKEAPKPIAEKVEVIDLTRLEPKAQPPKIVDTAQLSVLERQRQSLLKRIEKDPWARSDLAKVEKKIEDVKAGIVEEPKFVKKDIMSELRERWTKEEERLAKAPSQITKEGQILVMEKPEVIQVVKPKVEAKVIQVPKEEQIVKVVPKEKTRAIPLLFEQRPEAVLGERYKEIYKPTEEYKIRTVPVYKPVQVYKPAEITKQEPSAFQVPKEISVQIPEAVTKQVPEQIPKQIPVQIAPQYIKAGQELRPYLDVFWREPPGSEVPLDVPYMTKDAEKRVVRRKKPIKYTGKKRISPIFEGAEALFSESPIKIKPKKGEKEQDVLGLGNIADIKDPLRTRKPSKTNKVIYKEKQFWEV